LISAISNFIIPDHNATDVFIQPAEDEDEFLNGLHFFDNLVKALLGGLVRWDAQYFLLITKHGYIFENSLAFFPLFPLLTRWLSYFLSYFLYNILTESSIVLLSATIINFAAFLKAADVLYSLSVFVLHDANLAYIAALLFCFNPASVFFSAPYTESLFCLLTFSGMYETLTSNWDVSSSILFGLSSGTRSNGVLNVGFILFKRVKLFVTVLWPGTICPKLESNPLVSLRAVLMWMFSVIVLCMVILIPFLSFQIFSYLMYCTPQDIELTPKLMNYAVDHGLILPSLGGKKIRVKTHWCHSTLPLPYSYVQSHYWNVGFLKYFSISQIPNFLLALPIAYLILRYGIEFFNQHKSMCLRLGLTRKTASKAEGTFRMPANTFVFVVHSVVLTIFCFLCIHVQVTTRMLLSASPVPYWVGAYLIYEGFVSARKAKDKGIRAGGVTSYNVPVAVCTEWKYVNSLEDFIEYFTFMKTQLTCHGKLLILYFASYFVIGTILFSNFLPWT